ncbi:hypothetical protein BJ170DRAFT_731257 [Xylariales sp. AK1849]|nr:hypothetical protein BJ170DRAFT_731257 [Xylariales sp. AK1849]
MQIALVLVALAVKLRSSSGFTGASLVTLMSFGDSLCSIVLFMTRFETSIGAISRLRASNETVKPEDKTEEEIIPAEEWPQKGLLDPLAETVEMSTSTASHFTEWIVLRYVGGSSPFHKKQSFFTTAQHSKRTWAPLKSRARLIAIVMDKGKVVEVDNPKLLAEDGETRYGETRYGELWRAGSNRRYLAKQGVSGRSIVLSLPHSSIEEYGAPQYHEISKVAKTELVK